MNKKLENIGLGKNESKILTTLIESGRLSISEISKISKIHRTNVYSSLKKLTTKNLVKTIDVDSKLYEVGDLNILKSLIKEKEDKLKNIMPELVLNHDLSKKKSRAQVFEGAKAIRDILDGFLKFKEPILVYGVPKVAPEILGDWLIPHHKKRIKIKIDMLHIYNEDSQERIKFLNKLPHTEAKYLPKKFNSPVSTEICGDEVMIILWKKSPLVIFIKDKSVSNSYKSYFNILWSIAKK